MPIAGDGKRFTNKGYGVPKPLIEVEGLPMVIRAIKSLPKADKNIVIIRNDTSYYHKLTKILKQNVYKPYILEIEKKTRGQAETCLLAKSLIPESCILNIGSCDVGFEYNIKDYYRLLNSSSAFIWTYKNNPKAIKNPEMYGWVKINKKLEVEYVSCKKPVSKNLNTDPIISGAFTFKKASTFFKAAEMLIKNEDKTKGEFYVDNVFNHIPTKCSIFEINKYFSWGTPEELKGNYNL